MTDKISMTKSEIEELKSKAKAFWLSPYGQEAIRKSREERISENDKSNSV